MSTNVNAEPVKEKGIISTAEEEVALKLPARKIWYVMIILYLLYFSDYAARLVISPLFPYLQEDLGLSDSQLGMLSSVVLAGICILSMPLAAFIDRWRRGKALSLMAAVWSLATIGTGLSNTFSQMIISRAVVGVGEASFSSGGTALISAMFTKERRATINGIWQTAITLGSVFGLITGGVIASRFGWRSAFYWISVPGIILGLLAWFMPDYKNTLRDKSGNEKSFNIRNALKYVLFTRTLIFLYLGCGIANILIQSMFYWMPTFVVRYMGMTPVESGTVIGLLMAVTLVSYPLGGWLADRWAKKNMRGRMYLCAFSTLALGISCITAVMTLNLAVIGTVMFFATLYPSAQIAVTQEVVPIYYRATAFGGYVLALYLFGGLWGPLLTGMISNATELKSAFIIVSIISMIGSLFYFLGSRSYISDHNKTSRLEKEMLINKQVQR